jgi:hypothetical protein
MAATLAYCFAAGQIHFGPRCPKGALPIMRGPDGAVRDFICGVARHAYDGETLLVPGLPEAASQMEGLQKLSAFLDWIAPHAQKAGLRPTRRRAS